MPLYEFQCAGCGSRFEELVPAGTEGAVCPRCGSREVTRVLSAPGPPRTLTMSPGQARRAEDKRGTNRGGALQRFKRQRGEEKRTGSGRG
jgi:putative FmdB family regulatory protein